MQIYVFRSPAGGPCRLTSWLVPFDGTSRRLWPTGLGSRHAIGPCRCCVQLGQERVRSGLRGSRGATRMGFASSTRPQGESDCRAVSRRAFPDKASLDTRPGMAARTWARTERRRIVGQLLRDMRVAAALRQEDVAERIARPQSYVSKYESGELTSSNSPARLSCEFPPETLERSPCRMTGNKRPLPRAIHHGVPRWALRTVSGQSCPDVSSGGYANLRKPAFRPRGVGCIGRFSPEPYAALGLFAVSATGERELRLGAPFVRTGVRHRGQTAHRMPAA